MRSSNQRGELLARVTELGAAIALMSVALLVFASVALRYLFNISLPDAFDLPQLLMGIAIFWGIAVVNSRDQNIQMDLLWSACGPRGRWWLELCALTFSLLFMVLLTWMVVGKVHDTYRQHEQTFELRLMVWPFYALAWLGMLGATLALLSRTWRLIREGSAPDASPPDQLA